jgi:hypothetical protein
MMTRSTVTITTFALVSAILAVGIMIAVGSAAYALGGPGGSGRRGYPTHPPLHGPGSSHNPIIKRAPVHGPSSSHDSMVKRSLHGPVQATIRLLSVVAAVTDPWKRQIS